MALKADFETKMIDEMQLAVGRAVTEAMMGNAEFSCVPLSSVRTVCRAATKAAKSKLVEALHANQNTNQ